MKKAIYILGIYILMFYANVLLATNYYVSTTGSDGNNGSIGTPWQTIQHGLDAVQPGDTLYIRGGEYNEQLFSQTNGTANARIVINGYQNEQVIIDGTGAGANNGLNITHSYYTLQKIEVRDWPDTGVWIYGNIGFFSVLNCKIHDCPYCLSLSDGVHDFVVDGCMMYNFGPPSGGGDGFGFSCEPNGIPSYNGLIQNSISYHGRDASANNDGFALGHHDVSNITFLKCETYDVFDGFDMSGYNILLDRCSSHDITNGDGAYKLWPDSITLVNCVGYHAGSIVQLDYDGRPAKANLFNCTFHDATGGGYNIWIENANTSHLNMYNCIISGGDNRGLVFEQDIYTNYNGDYNIFQNDDTARVISTNTIDLSPIQILTGAWTVLSGQDAHSLVLVGSASLYIDDNGTNPILGIPLTSPAKDMGLTTYAPSIDYRDYGRTDGMPDIGAYEYDPSFGFLSPLEEEKPLFIFPNPSSGVISIEGDMSPTSVVEVYNVYGSLVYEGMVYTEPYSAKKTTIDLRHREAGIYFLCIRDGERMFKGKFVIWKR